MQEETKVYQGLMPLSDEEYRKVDAINASGLRTLVTKTPFHYVYEKANPRKETSSTIFGTYVHHVVLENGLSKFTPSPHCDRRTKDGKALAEAHAKECAEKGLISIDSEDYESLAQIDKEAKTNKLFQILLSNPEAIKERAVFATHADGFLMKGKVDLVMSHDGEIILCDLKTSESIDAQDFSRSIYNYGYHSQMAFYDMLLAMNGMKPTRHLIAAIENKQPHCFRVFEIEPEAIEAGRVAIHHGLAEYAKCKKTNTWPNYQDDIVSIGLPGFANTF